MAKLTPEANRSAALVHVGLSKPVLQLARGEAALVHSAFAPWCELPWYGAFADRRGRVPETVPWGQTDDTIVPLWSYGETWTVCVLSAGGSRHFAHFNLEDGSHELSAVAKNEQGLLADVMITVIESLDWESSEAWDGDARQTVDDAARAVDFQHLYETFAFLDSVPGADYEEHKRTFTRSL